jgi:ketosteroid isomerase-like protein
MKHLNLPLIFIGLLQFACSMPANKDSIEAWKKEVLNTELAFANMAKEEGVPAAFNYFAAEDAVLLRGETLLQGKSAIATHYEKNKALWEKAKLDWKPDFIDVSKSGDLAYTYGSYAFSAPDSSGVESTSRGVFHTVWKRQDDGSWKFVWD